MPKLESMIHRTNYQGKITGQRRFVCRHPRARPHAKPPRGSQGENARSPRFRGTAGRCGRSRQDQGMGRIDSSDEIRRLLLVTMHIRFGTNRTDETHREPQCRGSTGLCDILGSWLPNGDPLSLLPSGARSMTCGSTTHRSTPRMSSGSRVSGA